MPDDLTPLLMDANHRALVRAAARLLGPMDAEDAVQDAYVRSLESAPEGVHVAQAWLLTVVRHLAVDRLRRRQWMQQWSMSADGQGHEGMAPSAEQEAAVSQAARQALRWLAATLAPEDGAALLLREVFEIEHAEIAHATGRTEAASRQQLRRALLRVQQGADGALARADKALDAGEETVFRLFAQALIQRDPQSLWAMLTQRPVRMQWARALAGREDAAASPASPTTGCGVMQIGAQLGLVLTLDGVTLCVLPLGVRPQAEADAVLA
ncbi:RNA polymerase sigma factor [Roseateles amylovorans]|uniref:RNA polymerase sigma factor n=1 Tax=Roseateles amylovorans TaxID=2978473 RepID=A0ABY6AV99_9BURK|nr:RNA polymerase sigma factor [Roseateles amylovorans]UXH77129.1 RNA polymerase sigma factor [Roseateles amylovorans]